MKRVIGLVTVLVASALGTSVLAGPFTAGNIVVVRVGDGVAAPGNPSAILTNVGNVVYLDEYTTNNPPSVAQSIQIRTNYFGGNSPLILNGLASLEGLIARSGDGRFIALAGYGATLGQFTNISLPSTFDTECPRIVALIDGNGNVDSTTSQTNSTVDQESFRTAYTTDGTNIWFGGDTSGIRFTTRGSPLATQLTNSYANIRQINVFDNRMYFSTQSGSFLRIGVITNVMPYTTGNALETNVTGTTASNLLSPCSFVFLNVQGGASNDTLYVADDTPGGTATNVLKFCLVGGTWVFKGGLVATGARGITGTVDGSGTVHLYITGVAAQLGGGHLWRYTDSAGFNATLSGGNGADIGDIRDWVVAPPGTEVFRGVALVPQGGETVLSGAAKLSVGPALDIYASGRTGCSVSETDNYYLANLGGSTMSWAANCDSNWVSFSTSSSSLLSGGSVTIQAFFNANANSLPAGTNTTTINFVNNSGGLGNQSRFVSLILRPQDITPTTEMNPSGVPGGPFTASNKVYTVRNGGALAINLVVTNTYDPAGTAWLSYSVTNVPSLGTCSQTNINISLNQSVATNLAGGNYLATVIFSNATAGTVIDSIDVHFTVGGLFFCDDFSTFTQNAILAGQQGWQNNGQGSANEPFITNGVAFLPSIAGAFPADEPFKNLPLMTNLTDNVFAGLVMTVTSAPPSSTTSPPRMMCFYQGQNPTTGQSTPFNRDDVTVRDTGTGTFVFGARCGSTTANAWVFGTHPFNYGTTYRVIVQGNVTNNATYVYVNPSSATLDTGSAEVAMHNTTTFQFDTNVGAFGICNTFGTGGGITPYIAGIAFAKICINTNYADVYNSITTAAVPVTDFTGSPTSGAVPLNVSFTDLSTGDPTSWSWDFGDSSTSVAESPSHSYTTAGSYTVKLIACNDSGCATNTKTAYITVFSPVAEWQTFYGVTANGSDADSDGLSNTNEFLAGFNPNNQAAYLHIINVSKSAGTNVVVTYLGANGDSSYNGGPSSRTNVLEFTTGTGNGSYTNSFQPIGKGGTNVLSGGNGLGTVTSFVDTNGTSGATKYYRVRVLVP